MGISKKVSTISNKKCGCSVAPVAESKKETLKVDIDMDAFKKGVSEASNLAGKVAALISVGISGEMALSYFATLAENESVAEANEKVAKITADAQIVCSKIEAAQEDF